MAQANPTDIAALLQNAAVIPPAPNTGDDALAQLLAITQQQQQATTEVEAPTDQSSKVTVTTKKPATERPTLPSQTSEGQKAIASVDTAIEKNIQQQGQLNAEGQNQLAKLLGMENQVRADSNKWETANIAKTELEQANKVAVAKDSVGYQTRLDSMINDPVKNAKFEASMQEQMRLQGEIEAITSDNSAGGIFKQLFLLPGKRKDLTLLQNSNLRTQQQRGQATTNYFNNMQAAAMKQENLSAAETATIVRDQAIAQEGYKNFQRQGAITSELVSKIGAASGLSNAERAAYESKMGQLMKKDAIVLGDFQAALESTRLEVAQATRKKVLAADARESQAWADLQAKYEQWGKDTGEELTVKSIEGLAGIDPNSPIIARFDAYVSRTGSMSREQPWRTRLINIESGTHDSSDPATQGRDRKYAAIVDAKNRAIQKANSADMSSAQAMLDVNSQDPKMVARIDKAIAEQLRADSANIEEAIDTGRVEFVDFNTILKGTAPEEWRTTFPELDERDLKFIKEGGMEKLPTAISRNPARSINSMMATMVDEVMDLPPQEAKARIIQQSRILGRQFRHQLDNININGHDGLNTARVLGVESYGSEGTVTPVFELTSESDWAIRAVGAYVERVKAKKLGKDSSILGNTRGL